MTRPPAAMLETLGHQEFTTIFNFMFFGVDLRPESVIIVSMNSEERMKSWKELDLCEQIPWETWKRLVANMGLEKARLQAEKIIKKKLDKQG